jgi:hypothetical protein
VKAMGERMTDDNTIPDQFTEFEENGKLSVIAALIFMLIFIGCARPAMATVYNCNTEQAVVAAHGHFDSKTNLQHVVLKFDDETGTLWWAFNSSTLPSQSHLPVLQKMNLGRDLIAFSEIKIKGVLAGEEIFQISRFEEKSYGLTFVYSEPVTNQSLTGKCQREK